MDFFVNDLGNQQQDGINQSQFVDIAKDSCLDLATGIRLFKTVNLQAKSKRVNCKTVTFTENYFD